MITRRDRQASPQEIEVLVRPLPPRPRRTIPNLGAALGWGVPGAILAIIVVALAFNLNMLQAGSRWVLIVLMVITGAIAAAFLVRGGRRLFRAIAGPGSPRAAMTPADASKVRFTDVTLHIDEAWRLDIGDDDVPWCIFRCGDRWVSMYTGAADDLFEGSDLAHVGSQVTITLIGDVVWAARSLGPPLPVLEIAPQFDDDAQSREWTLQAFAEIKAADLWDDLARKLGLLEG